MLRPPPIHDFLDRKVATPFGDDLPRPPARTACGAEATGSRPNMSSKLPREVAEIGETDGFTRFRHVHRAFAKQLFGR
jgi:hypothetical protein